MSYVMRHGKRIEVEILDTGVTPKKRRKPFKAQWVKLPRQWVEALRRSKSVGTYQLALAILFEAFKRKRYGGEIVLSSRVTGMTRYAKCRAAKELVELGLIKTEQKGNGSMRVSRISYY
jgi:hypothetical protein